jgi:uncharacterized SAM-binding protein YcdF (DUF218 family)
MVVFVWKQLLKNLVLPPTGPLLLAVAGLVLLLLRERRALAVMLGGAGVASLWILSTPLAADALVRAAERYPALDLGKPVDAQAIVILGGGVRVNAPEYGRSAPGATTLERLVYGARVARITGLPVLVSGSHYEAAAMTASLQQDFGLSARWVENRSRDTHQNARFSASILGREGIRKVILVTSAAHMARSVEEFEEAGIRTVPAPAAMWTEREKGLLALIPNADALVRSQRACYEGLGLVIQGLRRRFGSLWRFSEPGPAAG